MSEDRTLAGDILRGAAEIAAYTGLPRRAIYHAAQRGSMPIRNVEGLGLVARKSALDAFFATPVPTEPQDGAAPRTPNPRARR